MLGTERGVVGGGPDTPSVTGRFSIVPSSLTANAAVPTATVTVTPLIHNYVL
ncbi:hypothetical protein [Streptomyces sp. YS415]|uniref:hypothetical protein n=1 Tax=Streptomyces sp. YS415 TaxID=2944806 RepID=UPI00202070C7|nr:hypothetical protein [Streptomyces sp. YS415]MCL7427135.1 hypothetical protein [Streptomyces sp. YS415]